MKENMGWGEKMGNFIIPLNAPGICQIPGNRMTDVP